MWVRDDQGTEYLRGQLSVIGGGSDVAAPLDLILNRKRVYAQWWVPSRPLGHRPKSITIRMSGGSDDTETSRAQLILPPTIPTVPRYLLLLGSTPKDDLDIQKEEADRQMHYKMSIVSDENGHPEPISDNSASGFLITSGPDRRHDPADLQEALKYADMALDLDDAVAARDDMSTDSWKAQVLFNKYLIERHLGRTAEALRDLAEAERLDPDSHLEKQKDFAF
jgi:tetratricopeptide (TPR) repeat protein